MGKVDQVLSGLKIIELGTDVAAANTGRLLAAYGADVITVEPPVGHPVRFLPPWPETDDKECTEPDPEASILFAYLGTSKRSVTLDLRNPADVKVATRLVLNSDAVVDSYMPGELASLGIDLDYLTRKKPSLSVVKITPYGQTGPNANWSASSLTSAASGGQMYLTGDEDKPPLMTAGYQAYYQASLHAFGALLTALYAASETGVGDIVDISLQEVQAATLEGAGPSALWFDSEQGRGGNNPRALWGVHPCKDGWIGVASMPRQTHSVLDVIGMSDLKDDPIFQDNVWSAEADDLLRHLVPAFTKNHTAEEIFRMADTHRAPFAMIPTPTELLRWPHYSATDFWIQLEHPILGRHPVPSGPIWFFIACTGQSHPDKGNFTPAPTIGQHTLEVLQELSLQSTPEYPLHDIPNVEQALPLDKIKIVDMTQVWSGPYATRFLADMGADVVKVEGPTFPDAIRTAGGARTTPDIDLSPYFNEYNRGKKSLVLDIKKRKGLKVLKKLIAESDIFIENWSSGVADRNELGYLDLKEINPNIIYVSMPGFGHTGPDSTRVGFGPTIEQMGGLVALQGYTGGPPHKSGISYGDPIAGATCAGAVLAGLLQRKKTGKGSYCVVPQRDGVTGLIGEFIVAEALGHPVDLRTGNERQGSAPHGVYPCKPDQEPRQVLGPDHAPIGEKYDRWVAIDCQTQENWTTLCSIIKDPRLDSNNYLNLRDRQKYSDQIDRIISDWTSTHEADEIAALFQSSNITASPVQTALLLSSDPHMVARCHFITVQHKEKGAHKTARPTWRLERRSKLPEKSGPLFGYHNEEILKNLNYSKREIRLMEQEGAISNKLL